MKILRYKPNKVSADSDAENYKIDEIIEDALRKWREIMYSWIGRLTVVMKSVLPN